MLCIESYLRDGVELALADVEVPGELLELVHHLFCCCIGFVLACVRRVKEWRWLTRPEFVLCR